VRRLVVDVRVSLRRGGDAFVSKEKPPADVLRPRVKEEGTDASKDLPSQQRRDTFHIGALGVSMFDSIRHTIPDRVTVGISARQKLIGSCTSVSGSSSSMSSY
jgi:hypothetical protein